MATRTVRRAAQPPPAAIRGGSNKEHFAQYLAAFTGLDPTVISAWLNHEQGSTTVGGGNNWLNIETGGPGGGSGPHSPTANWVETLTAGQAAHYTAQWIAKNQPSILAARGKGMAAEVRAIQQSGFAESHYGNEAPAKFLSAATPRSHAPGVLEVLNPLDPGTVGQNLSEIKKKVGSLAPPDPLAAIGKFVDFMENLLKHPLQSAVSFALALAGILLIVFGIMAAVRPRERALAIPRPPIPVLV